MMWSEYIQNSNFLEYTRKAMLLPQLRPIIIAYMHIKDGMKVLEVGCGSGYLSRFLLAENLKFKAFGIDNDSGLLDSGHEFAVTKQIDMKFILGDAYELPFTDESFDAVISHTFLSSIKNPQKALDEMVRVCKKDGYVSSITAMAFYPSVVEPGHYPVSCSWLKQYYRLFAKVWEMYEGINPITNYQYAPTCGELPHMFFKHGLRDISLFPIGTVFSLSDASISTDEKKDYINLSWKAECEKLMQFLKLPESKNYISKSEAEEYQSLLLEKRNYWLTNINDNSIFEWNGGSNLLISGRK